MINAVAILSEDRFLARRTFYSFCLPLALSRPALALVAAGSDQTCKTSTAQDSTAQHTAEDDGYRTTTSTHIFRVEG